MNMAPILQLFLRPTVITAILATLATVLLSVLHVAAVQRGTVNILVLLLSLLVIQDGLNITKEDSFSAFVKAWACYGCFIYYISCLFITKNDAPLVGFSGLESWHAGSFLLACLYVTSTLLFIPFYL